MQLGENIYKYRTERGLSQGGLADALEVSRQSVSKWENNPAVPELDKLKRMSKLFNISLDELVYGPKETTPEKINPIPSFHISPRIFLGSAMLLFGMVFFLLSVFWGDQLSLGEEFGELVSLSIVLVSITLIATYRPIMLAVCSTIYLLYGIACAGILHVHSLTNYIFMFLTGFVILIWFLILGFHFSKEKNSNP